MEYNAWSLAKGAITIATLVALQACGGGGDKKDAKQDISSAVSSVMVSSLATTSSSAITNSSSSAISSSSSAAVALKVSGFVADDALIGGEINAAIGDTHFTTTVDAQKSYQIDLTATAATENTPVVITAQGASSNQWVKLATLLPSVKTLKTLAGADNTLNATEFFGVTINNMTTAEYALAKQSNTTIKTDADRTDALLNISAEAQMDMASTLDLLLTDIDYELPASDDASTTLDAMLDAEESKAYIAVLKNYGDENNGKGFNIIASNAQAIEDDQTQVRATSTPIEGTFLVESSNTLFVLDMNKNGTGTLHSHERLSNKISMTESSSNIKSTAITWVKKVNQISIKLSSPIFYGKARSIPIGQYDFWDLSTTNCSAQGDPCGINLTGVTIKLINETDISKFIRLDLDVKASTLANGDMKLTHSEYASMKSMAMFVAPKVSELVGKEWYTNLGRYVFNENFTLTHTSLTTKITKTQNWKIEKNRIVLDSGVSDIWLHSRNEAGFTMLQIDHTLGVNNINWSIMVPRTSVTMTENDWLGHWSGYGANNGWLQYDFYKNKEWRFGLGSKTNNTWSAASGINKLQENANWQTELEIIAVVNNHYYLNRCWGESADPYIPSGCFIAPYTLSKDFKNTHFGAIWNIPAYQDQDNRIFDFLYRVLNRYDSSTMTSEAFTQIAGNKLYLRKSNTILELLSSNEQLITICEYPVFDDCASNGKKSTLTTGVEITFPAYAYPSKGRVTITGYNNIRTFYQESVNDTQAVAKNASVQLRISPNSGYKVGTVSGCEVVFTDKDLSNNLYYEIPARTTSCELKVDFVPL